MIRLLNLNSPKAVGVAIDGKIETADMAQIIAAVKEKLLHVDAVAVYVEMESFDGFSFDALLADLKVGLANFSKFSRKAVVSDKQWLARLTPILDQMFPSHELWAFTIDEKQVARDWVCQ